MKKNQAVIQTSRYKRWNIFFISSLFIFGIFIFFKPIILSGFRYSQTDIGDSVLVNFFLEHSFQVIFNPFYKGTLWSPLFFYPQPNTLTYSENLWGVAPIYWLLRAMFIPETAFQVWMIAIVSLNFITFFILSRSLNINIWFSGFGSFLFAFSLPRLMQLGHQQLLPQFYTALALFFLQKFLRSHKLSIRNWLLFELFVYLQFLAGLYLGWFLLFSTAPFITLSVAYFRNWKIIKYFFNFKIVISIIFLFVALFITLKPYFIAQEEVGSRSYSEVSLMTPSIASYLNSPSGAILNNLYPEKIKLLTQKLFMRHEHYLFLGFFVYFLFFSSVLAYLFLKKKTTTKFFPPIVVIYFVVFLTLTLISIRIPFSSHSLWRLIYRFVPGAGEIRAVARIWTISFPFLFLAIMSLASMTYEKTVSTALKILLFVLGVLACIEQVHSSPSYFDKMQRQEIQKQIVQKVGKINQQDEIDAFYMRWPEGQSHLQFQLEATWASIRLNIPTINGYSGNKPIGYKNLNKPFTNDEITSWFRSKGELPMSQKILVLDALLDGGRFIVTQEEVLQFPY